MRRRRHDHPLVVLVVADPRRRSGRVVSGTTFVPGARPRLPPNNTGRSLRVQYRCEAPRDGAPLHRPVSEDLLPRVSERQPPVMRHQDTPRRSLTVSEDNRAKAYRNCS
jgi:hypothetical protein